MTREESPPSCILTVPMATGLTLDAAVVIFPRDGAYYIEHVLMPERFLVAVSRARYMTIFIEPCKSGWEKLRAHATPHGNGRTPTHLRVRARLLAPHVYGVLEKARKSRLWDCADAADALKRRVPGMQTIRQHVLPGNLQPIATAAARPPAAWAPHWASVWAQLEMVATAPTSSKSSWVKQQGYRMEVTASNADWVPWQIRDVQAAQDVPFASRNMSRANLFPYADSPPFASCVSAADENSFYLYFAFCAEETRPREAAERATMAYMHRVCKLMGLGWDVKTCCNRVLKHGGWPALYIVPHKAVLAKEGEVESTVGGGGRTARLLRCLALWRTARLLRKQRCVTLRGRERVKVIFKSPETGHPLERLRGRVHSGEGTVGRAHP